MKADRIRLLFTVMVLGCAAPSQGPGIEALMTAQEAAWDAGDILGFMETYSDTICFIGSNGRTCGKEAVTNNYLKSYPDRNAMGDLDFTIHEVVPAGPSQAWVTGNWRLDRTVDTLAGGFSLFWVKERDGWRIVRDHTY
jgi:ketosteroid isomerase-like protein